jgi:hypothetical protein
VLLLWITAIVFLWLLASSRNAGLWQPSSGTILLVRIANCAQYLR